jgi:uncharacterized membrane protein YhaH (DUF805 family)
MTPDRVPPEPAVERRMTLAIGSLLILGGSAVLAVRRLGLDLGEAGWPLFVIVPGIVLFVVGLGVGGRAGTGFAVAGAVTTVTGLILAVQSQTGLYATWAYAWALVAPGGIGLGLFVYGALTGQRDLALGGLWTLLTGLVIFIVAAFFFESVIGLSGDRIEGLDALLAGAVVVLGVGIVIVGLTGGRRRSVG